VHEIPIQCTIDAKIDDFLAPVPSVVDIDVSFGDLESCWDPDTVHRYVDGGDKNSNADPESHRLLAIGEE
jgi:hypothetical protein